MSNPTLLAIYFYPKLAIFSIRQTAAANFFEFAWGW